MIFYKIRKTLFRNKINRIILQLINNYLNPNLFKINLDSRKINLKLKDAVLKYTHKIKMKLIALFNIRLAII